MSLSMLSEGMIPAALNQLRKHVYIIKDQDDRLTAFTKILTHYE